MNISTEEGGQLQGERERETLENNIETLSCLIISYTIFISGTSMNYLSLVYANI